MGRLGPRGGPGSVRTEILFDDDGILRIYHLGKSVRDRGVKRKNGILRKALGERLFLGAHI